MLLAYPPVTGHLEIVSMLQAMWFISSDVRTASGAVAAFSDGSRQVNECPHRHHVATDPHSGNKPYFKFRPDTLNVPTS